MNIADDFLHRWFLHKKNILFFSEQLKRSEVFMCISRTLSDGTCCLHGKDGEVKCFWSEKIFCEKSNVKFQKESIIMKNYPEEAYSKRKENKLVFRKSGILTV